MQKTASGCRNSRLSATYTLHFFKVLPIFLLMAPVIAGAQTVTKTISLNVKNAALKTVLDEVKKQTGVFFAGPRQLYTNTKPVTLSVSNMLLGAFLDKALVNQPITWRLVENTVFLSAKQEKNQQVDMEEKSEDNNTDSTFTVVGTVTCEGMPVPGAGIRIKKQTKGTVANANGIFSLSGIPVDAVLVVTSLGCTSKEITIKRPAILNVSLDKAINSLDESVVIAYGTTTRRFATGNIASVKASDIEKQPIQNPILALQGRVPGLLISQQTGYEHGPVKIEIRGRNSLNYSATSDPLYIIDGIPLTILDVRSGGLDNASRFPASRGYDQTAMSAAGGQNPFYSMNPSDIESIEVLKDADATAIYGSRGANGVILINTKKGKPGKVKLKLDYSQGVQLITRKWDMLNTPEYVAMRKEAFRNDSIIPTPTGFGTGAPDILVWDTTRYTDWQEYLWGGTGKWSSAQASVSGGSEQTSFFLSGSYNRSADITVTSGSNQKATVSFNLNNQSKDNRFKMAVTANYSYVFIDVTESGGWSAATTPPNAPPVFNSQGKLNFAEWTAGGVGNPFYNLLLTNNSSTNTLQGSLKLDYQILKGLNAAVSLGYNSANVSQTQITPSGALDPKSSVLTPSSQFGTSRTTNWIIEPQLNYSGKLAEKGNYTALVGGTLQSNRTDALSVTGEGFADDALMGSLANATTIRAYDNKGQYKYAGVFGRFAFNWADKYLLSLNGRRDGSSRFGPGNQFGNFGSVGAAWIVNEEPWMAAILPAVISLVKIRGSYGITGSDQVGDYQYLSQWGNRDPLLSPYNGVPPLGAQLQFNTNYHWEVNRKAEMALNLGFFEDQVSLEIAYYRNRCNNQLVSFPIPKFTGFGSVLANNPADVLNAGLEVSINARIINSNGFSWDAAFNISKNKNKLLDYPHLELSPYADTYVIGQPISLSHLYHYVGVDPATGRSFLLDADHDGKIGRVNGVLPGTKGDDRVVTLVPVPDFTGGFSNTFSYKKIQLTVFAEFSRKIAPSYIVTNAGVNKNIPKWQYENRWQAPGQITSVEFLSTKTTSERLSFGESDGAYTDASYIRIKALAISYFLPEKKLKKAKMSSLAINLRAENIFTITGYKGLDPDITSFGAMPPTRTITAGISCSF